MRLVAWMALVAALALAAVGWQWMPLADRIEPAALARAAGWLEGEPLAPLWVIAAFVAASLAGFPITIMVVAAALVLAPAVAFACALTGSLAGGALTFAVGRFAGREAVRRLAGARLNRLSRRLAQRGILTMVAVRVVPVAPFAVVNLVAGASHIRFRDFLAGTLIGMAPGILAVTLFARQAAAAILDPSPRSMALLVLLALLLAGTAALLRTWLARRVGRARGNARAGAGGG